MTDLVWRMAYKRGPKKCGILPNIRVIALQQCGQRRWSGGMKGRLIRARRSQVKEYLVKAKSLQHRVNTSSAMSDTQMGFCFSV